MYFPLAIPLIYASPSPHWLAQFKTHRLTASMCTRTCKCTGNISRCGREKHFPCNFQFNNNINSAKYTEAYTHICTPACTCVALCITAPIKSRVFERPQSEKHAPAKLNKMHVIQMCTYSVTDSKPPKNRDNFNLLSICATIKTFDTIYCCFAMRFVFRFSRSLSRISVLVYILSHTRNWFMRWMQNNSQTHIRYKLTMSLKRHSH